MCRIRMSSDGCWADVWEYRRRTSGSLLAFCMTISPTVAARYTRLSLSRLRPNCPARVVLGKSARGPDAGHTSVLAEEQFRTRRGRAAYCLEERCSAWNQAREQALHYSTTSIKDGPCASTPPERARQNSSVLV